jgi:hypothetical protein
MKIVALAFDLAEDVLRYYDCSKLTKVVIFDQPPNNLAFCEK